MSDRDGPCSCSSCSRGHPVCGQVWHGAHPSSLSHTHTHHALPFLYFLSRWDEFLVLEKANKSCCWYCCTGIAGEFQSVKEWSDALSQFTCVCSYIWYFECTMRTRMVYSKQMLSVQRCARLTLNGCHLGYVVEGEGPPTYFKAGWRRACHRHNFNIVRNVCAYVCV